MGLRSIARLPNGNNDVIPTFWIVIIITTILITCLPTNVKAFVNTRLENGTSEFEGRFEVTRNTIDWKAVCASEGFDINDVIVLCRQLGYPGANSAITTTQFGRGPYPMSEWAFACNGFEQYLDDCSTYNTECRDQSVAGAVCYRSGSGYRGCFIDSDNYPVFNGYVVAHDITMTIDKCVNYCALNRLFIYAGVRDGVKCFCGVQKNDYAIYGKQTDSACQEPCAGDPLRNCGGVGSLAVFHIQSIRDSVTVAATIQPRLTRETSSRYTITSRQDEVTGRSNMTDHSSTVTGHMVAKENPNFIKKPVGIIVVVAASLITIVLIILVICFIQRRKSSNDHERKQSLPAYEEVPITNQSDWPGSNDKSQSEHPTKDHAQRPGEHVTNEMIPDTYYSHPKETSANHDEDAIEYYATAIKFPAQSYAHTYEQAELLPNETVPSTYYSVPDEKSTNGSRRSSHVMVNGDLYAKPMKESPNNSRPTSHVIVNAKPMLDGDKATELRYYEYETVDGDTFITAEQYANNISENRDQNSHEIDPENSENDVNIADMYAKPMKKGRKANKKDSFDETCMVDNELYGN